jgi:hypothetical protein
VFFGRINKAQGDWYNNSLKETIPVEKSKYLMDWLFSYPVNKLSAKKFASTSKNSPLIKMALGVDCMQEFARYTIYVSIQVRLSVMYATLSDAGD